jgi:hypothetical protein
MAQALHRLTKTTPIVAPYADKLLALADNVIE